MPTEYLKFYDKEDRPTALPRLYSGAIVGHTTCNSSRVWVRAYVPGNYYLVVSTGSLPGGQPVAVINNVLQVDADGDVVDVQGALYPISLTFDTDLTGVVDVQGLQPATRYYYALFTLDAGRSEKWEVGRDAALSFRTQPESVERCVFGLYSCHMPFKGGNAYNMDMWSMFGEVLADNNADFVIGGGDQVYVDGDKSIDIWRWLVKHKSAVEALTDVQQQDIMLSWYRDIYRSYWGAHPLKKVFRSYPNYMIWDDHEIMDGWGSYTDDELSDALDTIFQWQNQAADIRLAQNMFHSARRAYFEYQHSHNPPTGAEPAAQHAQWDYAFNWGPLQFYTLDMRGHRKYDDLQKDDPDYNPILGDAQWSRFHTWRAQMGNATTESAAFFVVSPVPVIHANDFIVNVADINALGLADDLRDEWDHYSNRFERDKLLEACFSLSQQTRKPVVFLSGDVHVAASFSLSSRQYPDAVLYQITSSAITYARTPAGLLKLIVKDRGVLSNTRAGLDVQYQRLGEVFPGRNFGLLKYQRREGQNNIFWDLYGKSTEVDGAVIKLKRVIIS